MMILMQLLREIRGMSEIGENLPGVFITQTPQIKQALKLQELVKAIIIKDNQGTIAGVKVQNYLQSLIERSEK